ncbi:hypothetical protein scyTo_0002869 [Scyliorhinus torazame]|uniref:Uncharacterized protein n=1 Tax=Scyliorhinus torazame TaxID=75743 RepID=A0A401PKX4_SCYTO|nr:hypothetical protein [Scyliorhinus torazame]
MADGPEMVLVSSGVIVTADGPEMVLVSSGVIVTADGPDVDCERWRDCHGRRTGRWIIKTLRAAVGGGEITNNGNN